MSICPRWTTLYIRFQKSRKSFDWYLEVKRGELGAAQGVQSDGPEAFKERPDTYQTFLDLVKETEVQEQVQAA